ncbi:hypothetical protein D1868_08300 [Stygiolobus azoricus]|uniref:Uncharacterized protein n=2 Tax=Stygiolobus azoricus TaxID=41675 RepID=A0A650CQ61_9CREN|nr:hypothetical protein D1868_08300 [Stygiolobus azoricus]
MLFSLVIIQALYPYVLTSLGETSYLVKFLLEGPVIVNIIYNNSNILIDSNTTLTLSGKITLKALPTSLGYVVLIDGRKVSNTSLNINGPTTINITAIPSYVNLSVYVFGKGVVTVQLSNGSSYSISENKTFTVKNYTFVYINAPFNQNVIFNHNIESNFYVVLLNGSTSINVTFLPNKNISPQSKTQLNLTGIALGIIALAFYLFFRRKSSSN